MGIGTYNGPDRLVYAIDIGTTMSAVSYAHLRNGATPRFSMVMRWPVQEDALGECKVPTVVRYDERGQPTQYGAKAIENEERLTGPIAKWFKLWLHPQEMRKASGIKPPPLPYGVTLSKVYSDFLHYIFEHAQQTVDDTSLGHRKVPTHLIEDFHVVMAVPNGWDNKQQAFLRDALVAANILPRNFDFGRLSFVSESEASVHFAIEYVPDIGTWLHQGVTFAVLDAGGSTVDTTAYHCISTSPLRLEEVTSSECVQAGSALLDQDVEVLLWQKLDRTKYLSQDYVSLLVAEWEKKTKRRFNGNDVVITFGPDRVKLSSAEVSDIFHRAVSAIIASIDVLLQRCRSETEDDPGCTALLMVGGFAESAYLRDFLAKYLNVNHNVKPIMMDEATKKAAAEGACIWYAKHFVVARAARATYGTQSDEVYKPGLPAHRARYSHLFKDEDGEWRVPDMFNVLVRKNEIVHNDQSMSISLFRIYTSRPSASELGNFDCKLLASDSEDPPDCAVDAEGNLLPSLQYACTLRANLSGLHSGLRERRDVKSGKAFWTVDFQVEVFFGQTTLCATIVWDEKGKKRKGAVSVIPDSV